MNAFNQSSSAGSPSYMLTLSDYLTNYLGVPDPSQALPFFMELVDQQGTPQPLFINDSGYGDNPNDTEVLALKFDINPSSASLNLAKIVNRTQTMTGWVEEHWGEELDTITFQGSTAAFVMGGRSLWGIRNGGPLSAGINNDAQLRQPFNQALGIVDLTTDFPQNVGLTTRYRRNSVSYRLLKKILQAVHTNGVRFATDGLGMVTDRNYVRISHDYAKYDGYIESFDLTDDSASPYRYQYTITYKSEKTIFNYIR